MINVYPIPATTVIDYAHNKLHEGRYFSGGYFNLSVASSGTVDVLIQTGDQYFHSKVHVAAGGNATVQFYEGTTFSGAGTGITMSNHNRASAKVFDGTVTYAPTITLVGTQISGTILIPGGNRGSSVGGDYEFSNEFILNPSGDYLIRLTNVSSGAQPFSVAIEGYLPTL